MYRCTGLEVSQDKAPSHRPLSCLVHCPGLGSLPCLALVLSFPSRSPLQNRSDRGLFVVRVHVSLRIGCFSVACGSRWIDRTFALRMARACRPSFIPSFIPSFLRWLQGNCSPRFMRSTMAQLPMTADALGACKVGERLLPPSL